MYLGVESYGNSIYRFWETTTLFSTVAAPFYIPTNSVLGSNISTHICYSCCCYLMVVILMGEDFPIPQTVKNLPAMQETRVWSLGWEDPLEKGMAIHSSILAWRIPLTEKPSGLQFMGCQRVRHNWVTNTHTHTHPNGYEVLSYMGLICTSLMIITTQIITMVWSLT